MRKWMVWMFFSIVMIAEMGLSLSAQAHPVCNTPTRSMKKIRFISNHPDSPMSPVGLYVSENKSFIRFRTTLDNKSYPAIFVSTGKGNLAIPYHVCENMAIIGQRIDIGRITLWFRHSPIEITLFHGESIRKASERTPKE
jgi:hypothetical protein